MKRLLLVALSLIFCGCFTTLQTAKVKQGFHLTAATGILTDQKRSHSHGSDIVYSITPSYGFGHRIEVGVPVLWYRWDDVYSPWRMGEKRTEGMVLPYLKFAYTHQKNAVAIVGHAWLILPSSFTLIYSRSFDRWTPYFAVKSIFTADHPEELPDVIFRYQRNNQSIWVFSVGAEWHAKYNPVIELGLFRNSYQEYEPRGPKRVLYDLPVGMGITVR